MSELPEMNSWVSIEDASGNPVIRFLQPHTEKEKETKEGRKFKCVEILVEIEGKPTPKTLGLNAGTAHSLKSAYGSNTDFWVGKRARLFNVMGKLSIIPIDPTIAPSAMPIAERGR